MKRYHRHLFKMKKLHKKSKQKKFDLIYFSICQHISVHISICQVTAAVNHYFNRVGSQKINKWWANEVSFWLFLLVFIWTNITKRLMKILLWWRHVTQLRIAWPFLVFKFKLNWTRIGTRSRRVFLRSGITWDQRRVPTISYQKKTSPPSRKCRPPAIECKLPSKKMRVIDQKMVFKLKLNWTKWAELSRVQISCS